MKRIIILFVLLVFLSNTSESQRNIGIMAGGGFSYANISLESDLPGVNIYIINIAGAFEPAYQAGFNFENVIIKRMLYFQMGIQGMSKGYKYSDDLFLSAHSVHIPLEIKYKYFFNKNKEAFVYSSVGPYFSASYYGIEYDGYQIEAFLEDNSGTVSMDNPVVKFGKVVDDESADMATFDYGINIGSGFGFFGHLQVGFNYGLGLPIFKIDRNDYDSNGEWDTFQYFKHRYYTMTVAYYFSNK